MKEYDMKFLYNSSQFKSNTVPDHKIWYSIFFNKTILLRVKEKK